MATSEDLVREEIALLERKKAALESRQPDQGIKSSQFAATVMGINQGATFGFADEIAAGLNALSLSPFSDKKFGQIYDETLKTERANLAAANEQFPKTSIGATVAGGAAIGGAAAKAGTKLLSNVPRLPRLIGIGAAEGGLFGAGVADEDKLAGAAKGATIGAIATPLASGAVTALGRGITKISKPIVRAVANTPGRQAERIVAKAIDADELGAASVQSELSRLGPQAMLADLGENLSGLARGVTAKPGPARTTAANLLRGRQATQQKRLLKAAGVDFDIDDFKNAFNTSMRNRQSSAAPFYKEAYATPLQATPKLEALLKRPTMQSALKKATKILQDEGGGSGHVRVLDAAKQELDDQIGKALRQGKRNTARRLIGMKKELLEEIDAQVPSYRQAREIFSNEASLRDSANLGRSILTSRVNLDDAEIAIDAMTAGERQAFQIGSIRGFIDKLESTPESRNVAQKLIESPRARELLRIAFPNADSLNKFLQTARAESQFSFTNNRVLGGSPTTRIAEEVTDLSKEAGIASALRSNDPLSIGVQFLKSIGMGDVSEETLEQVSTILFSRKIPKRTASRLLGTPTIAIPEVTRQGAVGGAVGALSTPE